MYTTMLGFWFWYGHIMSDGSFFGHICMGGAHLATGVWLGKKAFVVLEAEEVVIFRKQIVQQS